MLTTIFFSSMRFAPCCLTSLVRLTSRLIIERFAISYSLRD